MSWQKLLAFTLRGTGAGVDSKTIGLTIRLNRAQIKEYLANIHNISREQLIHDLESVGIEFKGRSKDGRFMEFVDKNLNTRIKIHPAENVGTDYLIFICLIKKGIHWAQSLR